MTEISRRRILQWGAATGAGALLTACSSASSRTSGGGGDTAQGGKITLGLLAPLTGAGAGWGPLQVEGFKQAVAVLNDSGGIKELDGVQIELLVLDTETKPDVAAVQAEKLAQNDNVVMITGCNQSGASVVVAQVAQRNKIAFVTGTDADPLIVDQGAKYSFRIPAATDAYPRTVLDWVVEQEKSAGVPLRRLAILSSSSQLGQTATEFAVEHAEKTGFEIVDVSSYDPATSDFTPFVSRYKAANVQTFIGVHDPQPGVLLTRAMQQQDWSPAVFSGTYGTIGTDDWIASVGAAGDYSYNAYNWLFNSEGSDTSGYADAFEKLNGRRPSSSFDAPGGVVVSVLVEALRKAGNTKREDVYSALRELDLSQGSGDTVPILQAGGVRFDERGSNENAKLFVGMTKDKQVWAVSPTDVATEEPVVPRPSWSQIA
jgi:branched-chain amino acid transport system substrate-binding protein